MVTCTNSGCGKEFDPEKSEPKACWYHSGSPVFHEGLKGWSCCSKKVTDFDEFLVIPGCTNGPHTITLQNKTYVEPHKADQTNDAKLVSANNGESGAEVYAAPGATASTSAPPARPAAAAISEEAAAAIANAKPPAVAETRKSEDELHDPADAVVTIGMVCKRPGCGHEYAGSERSADECVYHSGEAVFHEGSKGWSCCRRKVLEFDEFLKIKGCKVGRHRFYEEQKEATLQVQCRHDWYQTQTSIIMSIFAKNLNKEASSVKFDVYNIHVDFVFADGKRFLNDYPLSQPILPDQSNFKFLSVKVELNLKKANGITWASLEPTDKILQWTTFGTSGRVGTVGAKEMQYVGDAAILQQKKSEK